MSVILALDFGVKKMGVAVGNMVTQTAEPLTILPMDNGTPDWQVLLKLINEWQATTVLVGLPLNMDASDSHLSKRATKFAKRLNHKLKEAHLGSQVGLVDERLSSQEAKTSVYNIANRAKKPAPYDDKAAMVLLISFFQEPKVEILP